MGSCYKIALNVRHSNFDILHCIIFLTNILVDCKWNDWQPWSGCSGTIHCGSGTRTKSRTKSVIENSSGTCLGNPSEIEFCDLGECPGTH